MKKIERYFLGLATIFGIIAVFLMPIFSVPDENTHFAVAYTVFHERTDGKNVYMTVHDDLIDQGLVKVDDNGLESVNTVTTYRQGRQFERYFSPKVSFAHEVRASFDVKTFLGRLEYLPQTLGILVGSLIYPSYGVMMIAGRLFNLAFYIVCIYFAIKKAKFGKLPMAMVALFPMSMQQAASVSYDVALFVVIFASFSYFTNLWTRKNPLSWSDALAFVGIFVALLIVKEPVLTFLLYFVTLPTALFKNQGFRSLAERFWMLCLRFKKTCAVIVLALSALAIQLAFASAGGFVHGVQLLVNTFFRPELNSRLDDFLTTGIIGNFGQRDYHLPEWLVIINFICFAFFVIADRTEIKIDRRVAVASGVIWFANIILGAASLYVSWTRGALQDASALVISGPQGRYYTPFLLVFIPIGIYFREKIKVQLHPMTEGRIFKVLTTFNLVFFLVICYAWNYTTNDGATMITDFFFWLGNFV